MHVKGFMILDHRNFINNVKKPDPKLFSVSVDLTKRRYSLLNTAKRLINNNSKIKLRFCRY